MNYCKGRALTCLLVLLSSGMFSPSLHAQNKVLGEIELVGASKVENTSSAPGIGDQTVIENSISCAEDGNFL